VEFLLWFTEREDGPPPAAARLAAMKEFAGQLASEGKLRLGAPLHPEGARTRIRVRDGTALVTDGPFAETREVVGGFWIVDVASREAALEIARQCPHARHGTVAVHPIQTRYTFADRGAGTPFLLAFRMEPGLGDPDGAKLREMLAFAEDLARDGKLFETTPLAAHPPPARVEVRSGKTLVTDGPFAEAKEAVAGYSVVRAAGREDAVALARRYPHARWGPVEVREILSVDAV
jgi:hypothetical protein